jgi:alpha-beta hydrolase superfamily lysophospholipase
VVEELANDDLIAYAVDERGHPVLSRGRGPDPGIDAGGASRRMDAVAIGVEEITEARQQRDRIAIDVRHQQIGPQDAVGDRLAE